MEFSLIQQKKLTRYSIPSRNDTGETVASLQIMYNLVSEN